MLWWEKAKVSEGRICLKIHGEDGRFLSSCVIPTAYYPLSGTPEVFNYSNTAFVTEEIGRMMDGVAYRPGRCYDMAGEVTKCLRRRGLDADTYAGWLFPGEQTPIHHCWTVLRTESGVSVIDISDSEKLMMQNREPFDAASGNKEKLREAYLSFYTWAKTLKNSERCAPVGKPSPLWYYVGSRTAPEAAKNIFRVLAERYPGHDCLNGVGRDGKTETQRMMEKL